MRVSTVLLQFERVYASLKQVCIVGLVYVDFAGINSFKKEVDPPTFKGEPPTCSSKS